MSFRTRLTGFFVLIVVVPMIAVGFLVFRLISDSQHGKAEARADGLASAAVSFYNAESADAHDFAGRIAAAAGESERAITHLELALDAEPQRAEALTALEALLSRPRLVQFAKTICDRRNLKALMQSVR